MKELRADLNSYADYFRKELENTRSQGKWENSFAEMQAELKALERMNNAEERISDVEDRIMEITQSGQQTENQMKKHDSNMRYLWNDIKWAKLPIRIPEGEEGGLKKYFKNL